MRLLVEVLMICRGLRKRPPNKITNKSTKSKHHLCSPFTLAMSAEDKILLGLSLPSKGREVHIDHPQMPSMRMWAQQPITK